MSEIDFDDMMDDFMDEMSDRIEDVLEEKVENAVICAVQDTLSEALAESLSHFELACPDGSVLRPRQQMKVLSPDKSKLLLCYGGLRVDGTSLLVQTRISCWDRIASYQTREEAVAALAKVRKAMEDGLTVFEL